MHNYIAVADVKLIISKKLHSSRQKACDNIIVQLFTSATHSETSLQQTKLLGNLEKRLHKYMAYKSDKSTLHKIN